MCKKLDLYDLKISRLFYKLAQNFKNLRPFEPLKYKKKRPNLNQKIFLKINNYEQTNKNHLHRKTTHRPFGALPAPSLRLKFQKIKNLISPITFHGDVEPSTSFFIF